MRDDAPYGKIFLLSPHRMFTFASRNYFRQKHPVDASLANFYSIHAIVDAHFSSPFFVRMFPVSFCQTNKNLCGH